MILDDLESLIDQRIREKVAQPVLATVNKIYDNDYYCDCMELTNDGQDTDTIYTRVLIPKLIASDDGGIFLTPSKGTKVLISFLNGDRNFPIISAVVGGASSETTKQNTLLIKIGDTEIQLNDKVKIVAGDTEIQIADKITLKNNSLSLAQLLKDIVKDVSTVKTADGKPFSPDDIAKLQLYSAKIDSLLGG